MHLALRALLIWMLMFAIPVQGIAASTMLLCGPSHHSQRQLASSQHDHAQHGHADHGGTAASDMDVDASSGAAADKAASSAHQTESAGVSAAKCSACASCCSAVALLRDLPVIALAQANASFYPTLSIVYRGFVADGPERPPRPFLA